MIRSRFVIVAALFLVVAAGMIVATVGTAHAQAIPPNLPMARGDHTATMLRSGKVLIAGGNDNNGLAPGALLYDPDNNIWTSAGSLATPRFLQTATLLSDGTVLVVGGTNGAALASAEIFDPTTGNWAATGSLTTGRYSHTATLLTNGKVLVVGGNTGSGAATDWTTTSSPGYPRRSPSSTPALISRAGYELDIRSTRSPRRKVEHRRFAATTFPPPSATRISLAGALPSATPPVRKIRASCSKMPIS